MQSRAPAHNLATSRKLRMSRSLHKTASRAISVGNSRELKGVEVSFVESTATMRTKEYRITQFGSLHSLLGGNSSAIGTIHQSTLLIQSYFHGRSCVVLIDRWSHAMLPVTRQQSPLTPSGKGRCHEGSQLTPACCTFP